MFPRLTFPQADRTAPPLRYPSGYPVNLLVFDCFLFEPIRMLEPNRVNGGTFRVMGSETEHVTVGRRILVVDDEPLVCDSVKWMLMSYGHEVEAATSGEQ